MSTICPNCQHPIRAGAKYCGFCGVALNLPGEADTAASITTQEQADIKLNSRSVNKPGSPASRSGREVSFVAIILLFLVIIVALVIRFWPEIVTWMNQILPWLHIR